MGWDSNPTSRMLIESVYVETIALHVQYWLSFISFGTVFESQMI